MRRVGGAVIAAALGCVGVVESAELDAPEEAAVRPEPTVVRTADVRSEPSVRISDADQPAPRVSAARAGPRCSEGFVIDRRGACGACTTDTQCRGECTEDTGRCSAAGWCEDAADCLAGERCDGGICVQPDGDDGPCGLGAIHFAWDSDTVTPGAKAKLSAAADCIASLPGRMIVEGHADLLGTEEFAIVLSQRRAEAVRDLLVAHRVPVDKLMVIAKGSLESTGTDAVGRARDRKVILVADVPVVP